MTTQKQIEANRRNAQVSTGPRTEDGKQRSRRNALRHGLTGKTVVVGVEDAVEYAAFEGEIIGEYDPKSAIERELTHRLASLLWRLRRANLIENGLFKIGAETANGAASANKTSPVIGQILGSIVHRLSNCTAATGPCAPAENGAENRSNDHDGNGDHDRGLPVCSAAANHMVEQQALTHSFLQLTELPGAPLEHISRYEVALWRQFAQTLLALEQARNHRIAGSARRFVPYEPQW